MPWWSIIYLFLFAAGIGGGIVQQFRERSDKPVVLVLDAVTLIVCAYLFVSFWIVSWRAQIGVAALPIYIAAVGWQAWTLPQALRKAVADPKVPSHIKPWFFVAIGLLIAPAVIVAGVATFR
jgi:hypothetical protein